MKTTATLSASSAHHMARHTAMAALVQSHQGSLRARARSILHDPDAAHDAVQEAFVRAWHEPRFFDPDFKQAAWLRRVVTNYCLNKSRDRRRREEILAQSDFRATTQASQPHDLALSYLSSLLKVAIAQLSPEHQLVIRERYEHDLTYREIADLHHIELGTVMSRLSRARRKLCETLPSELATQFEN